MTAPGGLVGGPPGSPGGDGGHGPRPGGLALLWRHRRSGGSSLLFAAGVALPRLAGLLTVPIYARLLGPADFGSFELLNSVLALLYALCILGLDFAISVRHFGLDLADQERDSSSAVAAAAVVSSVTAVALMLGSLVAGPVTGWLEVDAVVIVIVVAAVPFNVVGGVLAMYLRLRFASGVFFVALLAGSVAGSLAGVLCVVVLGWGLVGAAAGLAVAHLCTFAMLLGGTWSKVGWSSADRKRALLLVRLGAPLVPAGAAGWVFAVADRFFLFALFGLTEVGMYAAAARLATGLGLIQFGFHAAWGPIALRWSTLPDAAIRYAASLRFVAIAGGAAVAIVSWLASPLIWILAGPDYADASNAVWLLASSVLFGAMSLTVQIGASLAQRSDRIAAATMIAAGINTAANVALIPVFGYVGAGVATLIAYSAAYVIMYRMSQLVRPMRLEFLRSTAWATGWILLAASSRLVPAPLLPLGAMIVIAGGTVLSLAATVRFVAQASASTVEPAAPGADAGT